MYVMERNVVLKISELKENLENISVIGRVLSTTQPKTIQTKKGVRTISEAYIGDETGRVKLTLWGEAAGKIREGDVIEISNAWTTSFKGEVQLNAGSRSNIRVRDDLKNFPGAENIPETRPRSSQKDLRPGFGYRKRYKRSFERGRERSSSDEEE
jgi:replication factor A1